MLFIKLALLIRLDGIVCEEPIGESCGFLPNNLYLKRNNEEKSTLNRLPIRPYYRFILRIQLHMDSRKKKLRWNKSSL